MPELEQMQKFEVFVIGSMPTENCVTDKINKLHWTIPRASTIWFLKQMLKEFLNLRNASNNA